jgi:hypothetical protein
MCYETMLGFQIRHGSRYAPCFHKVAKECAERLCSSEDGGINRSDQMHLVVKRAFSRLTENQLCRGLRPEMRSALAKDRARARDIVLATGLQVNLEVTSISKSQSSRQGGRKLRRPSKMYNDLISKTDC